MARARVALITGVTGQDGAYLAELLLAKGYTVHGTKRRSSSFNTERVDHLFHDPHETGVPFFLHYGDMTDATNLIRIIQETQPDEIYNLAAQSHVLVSFETPEYTANADALGTLRLLEAIRILGMEKRVRFYQASTSELYGAVREVPQRETTPFYPRSPYGAAKIYAYWITVNYREAYGIHASNGILFNHEGPTRGETFVTRKITRAVAAIELGFQDKLYLGNLEARRDWGHARDFVEGMWLIVQQPEPDDYVLATGESHSIREFVEKAFARVGRRIEWQGSGVEERGVDAATGKVLVEIDARYFRPTEVESLIGDASKARQKLGWDHKVSFAQLVEEMVDADLKAGGNERARRGRRESRAFMPSSEPILVTGAAGFIGFHVARRLCEDGHTVVGVDNLNAYYDPKLKQTRLRQLSPFPCFRFEKLDLADGAGTAALFAGYRFPAVVHLAAQPGVRHSLVDPHAYAEANLTGFLNVLEGCRHHACRHLVYASSSSVYGGNTRLPFRVGDNVDHPLSLYGWTKKANELMAHAYAHLFALPATGLRFFTVYGPWGRPDMAMWLFTAAIADERPIRLFNHGQMRRDFTYIDDAVEAVVRLVKRPPAGNPQWSGEAPNQATSSPPWRIYNVGNRASAAV